jgi:glucose/arabinose dehydrogenase
MKSAITMLAVAVCAAFVLAPLAASAEEPFDIQSQIGPNPVLPDIQQYLFPPMHLASVVGWKNGEKPTVAAGLKIEALADGLQHPRSLYTLPNGDVLVVESKAPPPQPITRPKDIVMRFIEKWVTSGGDPGPSNRITLLRYDPAGGKPPTRSVFLDHLHSPSAWSWLVTISMSPTPTPSCATPTTPATRRSLRAA